MSFACEVELIGTLVVFESLIGVHDADDIVVFGVTIHPVTVRRSVSIVPPRSVRRPRYQHFVQTEPVGL